MVNGLTGVWVLAQPRAAKEDEGRREPANTKTIDAGEIHVKDKRQASQRPCAL